MHQIPTFEFVNDTITYLKPELRLLVSDVYKRRNQPFVPRTFLTLIDIEKEGWHPDDRARFFSENFRGKYDIIECSVNQLRDVHHMCVSKGSFPRVLVLHANEDEQEIILPTNDIRFFIVVGNVRKFFVSRNEGDVIIFHRRIDTEGSVSFYKEGVSRDEALISGEEFKIDYRTKHEISLEDASGQLGGKFRPAGFPHASYPDAVIRQVGPNDQMGDGGKESYIISSKNEARVFPRMASIIASRNEGISIVDVRKQEQISAHERETGRFVIVHGRIKVFERRTMIKSDSQNTRILFPDMSQKEVDSILLNRSLFYGNDRKLKSGSELVGFIPSLYFTDGLTFSEQMLNPKGDHSFTCLSYIDNYFDNVRIKYPNGFFDYMITKYTAELEDREINFAQLRNRPSIYNLINVIKEKLQSESKVDANKRSIMLARIKALTLHQRSIPPYFLEPAVDNPVLSEEQRFKTKHFFNSQHDPMTHDRKYFMLKPVKENGQYIITDINYMILDGNDYDCVIHNCGFVILQGTGNVRVSGTVHSLICYGGVNIKLDNISHMPFPPDTYLYTENGSVYDTITDYKDNIPIGLVEKIAILRTPETISRMKISTGITVFPDVIEGPPPNPTGIKFGRSVVRNLYVNVFPENYRTAMIENLVHLGYAY